MRAPRSLNAAVNWRFSNFTTTPVPSTSESVCDRALGVRSTDPMVDYLPSTAESLRGTIVKLGLLGGSELNAALAECRAHLARPGTSFTMYTVAQVWGLTA